MFIKVNIMIKCTKITPVILVQCTKITGIMLVPSFHTRRYSGLTSRAKRKKTSKVGAYKRFVEIIVLNFGKCPICGLLGLGP